MVAQYRKASPAEINSINTPKRANRVAMKSRENKKIKVQRTVECSPELNVYSCLNSL